MNLATILVAAAVVLGIAAAIRKIIKRKGRCAFCDGSCPGCDIKTKKVSPHSPR